MSKSSYKIFDANSAVADIAYRTNEICIIYPITPASTMGELCDQWQTKQQTNSFGTVPDVIQMQSEGGAAGAIHGAVQTGSLVTTFTASQGLLLMIPDMYRIAGELTPTVFHVASRAVATQGMTIYCDHTDVMATRATGFALLSSANVQEAHDMALVAQAASLESRIPFLHFFDGFRTSHEMNKIAYLTDDQITQVIDNDSIIAHQQRRMSTEQPISRGVIYNSDIYFQQRETTNQFYDKAANIVQHCMSKLATTTNRHYKVVEYYGHSEAERIIILLGSGVETVREYLNNFPNEKIGLIYPRLLQPLAIDYLLNALPKTCQSIAVLDRCKEPGATGEPLYQTITTLINEAAQQNRLPTKSRPKIVAGRYGIGGKEFTPAMVRAIFTELTKTEPKLHFTIGINDDLTNLSLPYDTNFHLPSTNYCALFYGLGADGTVSANKNSIKIIGEQTDKYVQAYFEFDSRKSGSRTISHLRFGPNPIRATYLITHADFIGCHQFTLINTLNILDNAHDGATVLLNSPFAADNVWQHLAQKTQQQLIAKHIKLYIIDAYKLAAASGLGGRINTIMQTCFFALTDIIENQQALTAIKATISKTYANKGYNIIEHNFNAITSALNNIELVPLPESVTEQNLTTTVNKATNVTLTMLQHQGNTIPVSALPADGTYPTATTKLEQRDISLKGAEWLPEKCIQCGRCNLICPHNVIRTKCFAISELNNAPKDFKFIKIRNKESAYSICIHLQNCTGCGLCVAACPIKDKALTLTTKQPRLTAEKKNEEFFNQLTTAQEFITLTNSIKDLQYIPSLFEFSGACAGCGEAPYVKLLAKLFGSRLLIANACGCSSVFGGNLPTSPWTCNEDGHGPTWSSSLFEDNAEFAFGFLLSEEQQRMTARQLLTNHARDINNELCQTILSAPQTTECEIQQQRQRVKQLKQLLQKSNLQVAPRLLSIADFLVKHSVWALGGDGWAYDIGFGGVDHVLASGRDINLLVLDTEVYSNTGGQASKATPKGSVVKFAANGKTKAKKDLGLMAMTYGDIYVASIAIGANPTQAIKAMIEAENYPGPSLIIAYCHCIAHGIDMTQGLKQQKLAVESGHWPLYRFDPRRRQQNLSPLQLDAKPKDTALDAYTKNENRFAILTRSNPDRANELAQQAANDIKRRWQILTNLSQIKDSEEHD